MKYFLNDRQVEISETETDDGNVMVIEAYFLDGEMDLLTEKEMTQLEEDYQDSLAQEAYEHACNAAHEYYEGDR